MVRPDAAALNPDRQIRVETDRLLRAACVSYVAIAFDRAPCRRHPTIVEGRFADERDLDLAFETQDGPHEQMVSVVVGGRPGMRRDLVLVILRTDR
jgi:hypothetical protein